ncbi:MAG TPA: carbon storage regulator [Bryobacteraceae bacterium]|nr:carbon storage regulator [Bryobacteraceae bacterium]
MMVMRRREGEKILIGDNIVIHIHQIGRNRVRVGIEAPREIRVVAEEVQRVGEENTAAAAADAGDVLRFLQRLQSPAV